MGQRADEASIKAINRDLGLDKPISVQFIMYVNDLSPISVHSKEKDHYLYLSDEKYDYNELIDFGEDKVVVTKVPYLRRSYQTKRKVSEIIIDHALETFILAFSAIFLGVLIGIPLGIVSAVNKGKKADHASIIFSTIGISGPSFFTGSILGVVFGYTLADYTGLNTYGSLFSYNDFGEKYLDLKNLILPAITLGIRPISIVTQLMRSSLLEVLSVDYIRTARAKGVSQFRVLTKHALKNALSPVVTAVSGWFASLMAGAVLVEIVFSWKGIGYVLYKALTNYDLPIVMGIVLMISVIFILLNIIVDIFYAFLDPRVRFK